MYLYICFLLLMHLTYLLSNTSLRSGTGSNRLLKLSIVPYSSSLSYIVLSPLAGSPIKSSYSDLNGSIPAVCRTFKTYFNGQYSIDERGFISNYFSCYLHVDQSKIELITFLTARRNDVIQVFIHFHRLKRNVPAYLQEVDSLVSEGTAMTWLHFWLKSFSVLKLRQFFLPITFLPGLLNSGHFN